MLTVAAVGVFWFIAALFLFGIWMRDQEEWKGKQRKVYDELRDSDR